MIYMTAAKRRPGALPGTINNPTGKNQFDGDKGKTIAFRLPIELDGEFRTMLTSEGKTNTEAMIEAVNLWVANKKSAKKLETQ
jgi:hypothetical protein